MGLSPTERVKALARLKDKKVKAELLKTELKDIKKIIDRLSEDLGIKPKAKAKPKAKEKKLVKLGSLKGYLNAE